MLAYYLFIFLRKLANRYSLLIFFVSKNIKNVIFFIQKFSMNRHHEMFLQKEKGQVQIKF